MSRHSFILKMVKKLFKARTHNPNLFKYKEDKSACSTKKKSSIFIDELPEEIKEELAKNRSIHIRDSDSSKLFCLKYIEKYLCCCFKIGKSNKLKRLFDEGERRIESELNVVKVIKSLKKLKILIKNSMMDENVKLQIEHNKKNVINLESSCED